MSSSGDFHLTGEIDRCAPGSSLDLSFCANPYLYYASVDMNNDYYTFNGTHERQGKRYRDDKTSQEGDLTEISKYSINLAWKGDVKLNLKLTHA